MQFTIADMLISFIQNLACRGIRQCAAQGARSVLAFAVLIAAPVVQAGAPARASNACARVFETAIHPKDLETLNLLEEVFQANDRYLNEPAFTKATLDKFALDVKLSGPGERASVDRYLEGSNINLALRGHFDTYGKSVELEPFKEMIAALDSTLPQLHSYRGVSFRGESMSNSDLARLHVGSVLGDPGYSSSSLDLRKAGSFEARFSGQRSVLLVIAGASGRIIPSSFYHRKEWEVLFPRGTSRKVLKIDLSDETRPVIYVQEISKSR